MSTSKAKSTEGTGYMIDCSFVAIEPKEVLEMMKQFSSLNCVAVKVTSHQLYKIQGQLKAKKLVFAAFGADEVVPDEKQESQTKSEGEGESLDNVEMINDQSSKIIEANDESVDDDDEGEEILTLDSSKVVEGVE